MLNLKNFEVWFVTGSQHLYGEETLRQVDEHSKVIADALNQSPHIAVSVVFKPVVKTPEEILQICREANATPNCIGIIAWMHTFSPAKMWIRGLNTLQLPLLHLHTQFNRDIPYADIDMDFMNLNQSAHGDREFGFIMSKLRMPRKVVVGHWQDASVHERINVWSRVAAGVYKMKTMKVARFGDNMRQVAVTDGDKVAAEDKFGFSVNTYAVGDLVSVINQISDTQIDTLLQEYEDTYALMPSLLKGGERRDSLIEAARIELGLKTFLEDGGFSAYTNTFEDLYGMRQLPGIGSQRMMAAGYGYGGEGDWKTSALVHVMKLMASGMKGGNSFMEDYTYHFEPGNEMVLGSHMLEICPSIAEGTVNCEVHPLGIGGKEDPVRLVFNGAPGNALNASLIDLGNRFRLLVNEVEAVKVDKEFPKLPTARVLWKPQPSMEVGLQSWILGGGAHHTVYSQNLTTEYLEDFAEMLGIELLVIGKGTTIRDIKNEIRFNDIAYK
ncbi:L-arabinose isomerase [Leadbetterella byssophila DSM 17132]|jgi:L-arabinose isomerase|uniref:L-arabinose isomerase n=1 Tax=Leadbetterella byssophila (strain DSM 17132 / JCM 16389 / KACC 11308 / NBRC 106382 / 4M15) TaxID=649349 RepID=E4RYD5_LEAB4|nr:L-arabinose isomerase [Leadbetterella byssophila]ADQ18171.1 L-arabinose isomerase [Leadbetterella byssophila DSM 17132]